MRLHFAAKDLAAFFVEILAAHHKDCDFVVSDREIVTKKTAIL